MGDDLLTFADALIKAYEGDAISRKIWVDSDTIDVIFVKTEKTGESRLKISYNDGSIGIWLPTEEDIFAFDWYVVHEDY